MLIVLYGEDEYKGDEGGDGGIESDILKPYSGQSFDLDSGLNGRRESEGNNDRPGVGSANRSGRTLGHSRSQ